MALTRYLTIFYLLVAAVCTSAQSTSNTTWNNDNNNNGTLIVGMVVSNTGVWSGLSSISKRWANIWSTYVNSNQGGIQPHGWSVKMIYQDVQSNATLVPAATQSLIDQGAHVLLAADSTLSLLSAQVAEKNKIPIISYIFSTFAFQCVAPLPADCKKIGDRRFSYFFSSGFPASSQFRDYYQLMNMKGAKTVGILYYNDDFNAESCLAGNGYAEDNNMKVTITRTINATTTPAQLAQMISDFASTGPDIVTLCHRADCASVINEMYNQKYFPKSLVTLQCIDNPAQVAKLGPNKLKYVNGITPWDSRIKGPEYQDGSIANMFARPHGSLEYSPSILSKFWTNLTGTVPDFFPSLMYAQYEMIWIAASNAQTLNREEIRLRLSQLDSSSQFGRLAMGPYGMNQYKSLVIQQTDINGVVQLISPASTATAGLIYPIPSWEEREYTFHWASTASEQVILLFVALVTIVGCSLIYLLIKMKQHHRELASLHVPTAISTIIGFVCLAMSILTWMVDNSAAACKLRIPTVSVGIFMILSSQIYRTYIIFSIFFNSKLQVVKIGKQSKVIVWITCIVIPAMLAFIWSIAEPLQHTLIQIDPLRFNNAVMDCSISTSYIGYILFCWTGALLGVWSMFIWWNRNIEATFSRTISLVLFVYMFVFSLIVIAIVQLLVTGQNSQLFALRSGGIIVICLSGMFVLYGMPVLTAYLESNDSKYTQQQHTVLSGIQTREKQNAYTNLKHSPNNINQTPVSNKNNNYMVSTGHRKQSTSSIINTNNKVHPVVDPALSSDSTNSSPHTPVQIIARASSSFIINTKP